MSCAVNRIIQSAVLVPQQAMCDDFFNEKPTACVHSYFVKRLLKMQMVMTSNAVASIME